ncbi:MAG: molybdenum ABC transporter ATP-binding protein [Rhodocyclaceae bacterium]|nr:molybdenum ABC transporter ATP-binding protein [Rhodocyclaceae bacterium]
MTIRARLRVPYPAFALEVDLELPGQGVTALFGPSGSGKTTLLRCIAGLERAAGGFLEVESQPWQDGDFFLPTHRRPLGYVFQEANLFPHLTARRNLEYGMKRVSKAEQRVDLDHAVELLGIGHLLDRLPDRLSGGERQRVAIARALLTSPRLLLMDEPLSALDQKRKDEILPYLERLHDELAIPVLYVSHAIDEVARIADHLVILDEGRALASGPALATLARLDLPTAQADDAGAVIQTTVAAHEEDSLTRLEFPGGSFLVSRRQEIVGHPLRLRIHARDVSLALSRHDDVSILNRLPVRVTGLAATHTPGHVLVGLDAGGTPLLARITERSRHLLAVTPGLTMWAQIKTVAVL